MSEPKIAYFSAEYAIADDMPIYAGGLGVLAADMVFEAGALDREFTAVGLVYHLAFTGDDPDQRPMTERLKANGFRVAGDAEGKPLHAAAAVADRTVVMQAWVKEWGRTKLVLLDTNLSQNMPGDRAICDRLYAADPNLQLAQEICLGFGGVAMLEAMDIEPDVYHLNEGHTALAGLAVVMRHMQASPGLTMAAAVKQAQPSLVGTKHTILAGAGILLDWGSVTHQLEPMLQTHGATIPELQALAGMATGDYSDTKLMIAITRIASGVSKIHVAAELTDHPESQLITITNGVYRGRWAAGNWGDEPLSLSDEDLWLRHRQNQHELLKMVHHEAGVRLSPDALTVVWSRRMASYKRPELLVSDLGRLAQLAHQAERPIQFVVAGRANPADAVGVDLMKQVISASKRADLKASFAYVPHYNPTTAKLLVRGADLWLNTPIRGYEACGTSGMKASLNGALQFSTSDGWIDEINTEPIGWILPEREPVTALYDTLERTIAPLFYTREANGLPTEWIARMRANMELILHQFTAERMLTDYYERLYQHE